MTPRTPTIRGTQVILLSLTLGVVSLCAVAVVLRLTGRGALDAEAARILPLVTAGVAVAELAVYFVLRRSFLARVQAARAEALELVKQDRVPLPLHTLAIVGGALAEGAGMLGAVALLLGGPWYLLAAPVLAIALIVAQLPSKNRLETLVRELPA